MHCSLKCTTTFIRVQTVYYAGNLHFANVNLTDNRGGLTYKCNVVNWLADTVKAGSYAVVNVARGLHFVFVFFVIKFPLWHSVTILYTLFTGGG